MLANQTIALSNRCNLACTYCWYETDSTTYPAHLVGLHDYDQWFAACASYGTLDAAFLTGGEPLLRDDFAATVALVAGYFRRTAVLTNGVLLADRPEFIRAISVPGAEVHVSLDHVSATLRDSVRGGTKHTLRGISHLVEAGIPTLITMVLTSHNAVDLVAVIDFCRREHLGLEVNVVALPQNHPLSVLSLSQEEREKMADVVRSADDVLGRTSYYAQVRTYLRTRRIVPLRRCRTAESGVFIDSDGAIRVCSQRRRDPLGSILHDSPSDVLARKDSLLSRAPGGPCVSLDCLTLA